MKKLLVHAGLMIGSVLILGAAANAQLSQQYRAEIPFDFHAAGAEFSAGQYKLVPVGTISTRSTLAILDVKNSKMRLLGQSMPGKENRDGNGKLIFIKADGRYTLSEVVTPNYEIKMKGTKTDVRVAGGPATKLETVAINLH
jgi:hypothetical protein